MSNNRDKNKDIILIAELIIVFMIIAINTNNYSIFSIAYEI